MNAFTTNTRQIAGQLLSTASAVPAEVRARIETWDTINRPVYSLPAPDDLQVRFSQPHLNFVAKASEFFSQECWEMQLVVYGICRTDFSAHICGVFGTGGYFRAPAQMLRLKPSRIVGLPPEIDSKSLPGHYGDALDVILAYIDTVLAPTRSSRATKWL